MKKRSGLKDTYLGVLLAFAFTILRRTLVKARVDVDKSAYHHLSQSEINRTITSITHPERRFRMVSERATTWRKISDLPFGVA
jgi:hypothetical protein